MPQLHPIEQYPPQSPRQNRLLAALPPEDYVRLLGALEPVALPRGKLLHFAGDREQYLYFITAGLVSRYYVMENGDTAEFALTGNEGVIGLASFLGGNSTTSQAVVLDEGHAYRLKAELTRRPFERAGSLVQLLLRYTLALMAQTGQVAACNRHHAVEQRLCRWLLTSLDHLPANELTMTHEQLGEALGVRRESASHAAAQLQQAGAIRYNRGNIEVLDRRRLEARACECHQVVKRECDRLFPATVETDDASTPNTAGRSRHPGLHGVATRQPGRHGVAMRRPELHHA